MRKSVCSAAPAALRALPLSASLPPVPRLLIPCAPYAWPARVAHRLAAWLIARHGQPTRSEDEAFLALSLDHADCERRQRVLAQRHTQAWRLLP
jgi:hypothetical protein